MYLKRLFIENYRSIKELDLKFSKGKNIIVGRNNSGKSNIVKALDLVLGERSPTYQKADNINDNDFYSWKENNSGKIETRSANEFFIWAELERDPDESLDYDEIYKCWGYYVHSRIVQWGKPPIKEAIRIPHLSLPKQHHEMFTISEDDSKEKEYINPKLRQQKTFESQLEGKKSFAFAFKATKLDDVGISRDIRFLYRETDHSDWILGFKAPVRNELLQSAIIPSFRDPQSQLKLSNWTWYGKLMQHLTCGQEKSKELSNAFSEVTRVANKVFEAVKDKVAKSALDVAFPGTELHFQFNADTKTELYKNCVLYVDDGFKSLLTDKGSGVQSAIIIGLFNYFVREINSIASALLCIEEPELYLHPHARRVISDRLDEFLENNKNQVIITTHSVEFIRSTTPQCGLTLVRKQGNSTSATPVDINEFKGLIVENNQNEIFFADSVVVCEGYDDYIVREAIRELFPKHLDEGNISVVSVGGKDNISRLAKLIQKLGIRCFIFADFDYLLRDKSTEREKYSAKAHESILSLGTDFFSQPCIFGTNGCATYSKLQSMREALKKESEERFYKSKRMADFDNSALSSLLSDLRDGGVGILEGEIEDYSRDQTFLSSSNKLSLDKIYAISEQLGSGKNLSELIDIEKFKGFIGRVVSFKEI